MPFQLSPGVVTKETDLTTRVPAAASSIGAIARAFGWGPVNYPSLVSDETSLIAGFGAPVKSSSTQRVGFMEANNFLAYAGSMYIIRTANAGQKNACETSANATNINNLDDFTSKLSSLVSTPVGQIAARYPGSLGNAIKFVACDGGLNTTNWGAGNTGTPTVAAAQIISTAALSAATGLTATAPSGGTSTVTISGLTGSTLTVGSQVVFTGTFPTGFNSALVSGAVYTVTAAAATTFSFVSTTATAAVGAAVAFPATVAAVTRGVTFTIANPSAAIGSTVTVLGWSGALDGTYTLIGSAPSATVISFNLGSTQTFAAPTLANVTISNAYAWDTWAYKTSFDYRPGTSSYAASQGASNDEFHALIIDSTGIITGAPGTILEKWVGLSKFDDAKTSQGLTAYWEKAINAYSKWIWAVTDLKVQGGAIPANFGVAAAGLSAGSLGAVAIQLAGGADGTSWVPSDAELMASYGILVNDAKYPISLIIGGAVSSVVANYLIQNVAEIRGDCITFITPNNGGSAYIGDDAATGANLITYRNQLTSSSYYVLDSGFKYQYDKFSDTYQWVPMAADVAGLCAKTDAMQDPWFSPAGLNRGQIKNVVKLAHNPDKATRDQLYQAQVNPIISMPGQGIVLFGDKTGLTKPSAFDRINVRRLFIVVRQAVRNFAQYSLFEMNTDFTRQQFVSAVTPFLRDVQGRGGLYDFRVVCDTRNNTPEVIDGNEFRADIYLKPTKSINFITLNFVAARTGVEFSEIGA